MALENLVGADKFLSALVPANPVGADDKREGDDHIRGIKNVLKNTFPNINGAVTATDEELGSIAGKVNRAGDTMTGMLNGNPVLAFGTGGTERMRIDAAGNVGIGTDAPATFAALQVTRSSPGASMYARFNFGSQDMLIGKSNGNGFGVPADGIGLVVQNAIFPLGVGTFGNAPLIFGTQNAERMRIDAAGNVLIGAANVQGKVTTRFDKANQHGLMLWQIGDVGVGAPVSFLNNAVSTIGSISSTASGVAYNTSSDYRLKNITGELHNSGAFIDALEPKQGTWKADGAAFVGFIAHELAAVSPSSVTGEKDAIDKDGNPDLQQVFYGSPEMIANIVAELKSLRARVAALEGA